MASLAACATSSGPSVGTQWLSDQAIAVSMSHGFSTAQIKAVSYQNPSEYEQYVRITDTAGARAELLLDMTIGAHTALQLPEYQLPKLNRTWVFNQAPARVDYEKTRGLNLSNGSYRYRLYQHRLQNVMRSCVSFVHSWDHPPDDPRSRPGKALFGYYCAAPGQELHADTIHTLLEGIMLRPIRPAHHGYGQGTMHAPDALPWAQGQLHDGFGNSQFPFQFTRYYVVPGDRPLL